MQEKSNFIMQKMAELGGESKENFSKAEQAWNSRVASVPLFKTNPTTGIPVTYYKFMQIAKKSGLSEVDAVKEWLRGGQ